MNARHLAEEVVRPTLIYLGLWSLAAEQLVMGTAAQESQLHYRVQLGGGPALGLWQMEPATYRDIWDNFLRYRADLALRLKVLLGEWPNRPEELTASDAYAAAMCRVHYLRDKRALPAAGDVRAMAATWKRWYNTDEGKGKPAEFVRNWNLTIKDLYPTASKAGGGRK